MTNDDDDKELKELKITNVMTSNFIYSRALLFSLYTEHGT